MPPISLLKFIKLDLVIFFLLNNFYNSVGLSQIICFTAMFIGEKTWRVGFTVHRRARVTGRDRARLLGICYCPRGDFSRMCLNWLHHECQQCESCLQQACVSSCTFRKCLFCLALVLIVCLPVFVFYFLTFIFCVWWFQLF